MLSYYRMPYYYAAFVPALLVFWGVSAWRDEWRQWTAGLLNLAAIAVAAALLIFPWVGRIMGSTLAEGLGNALSREVLVNALLQDYLGWRYVTNYVPLPLLIAAGVGLIWALWRRQGLPLMVGAWALLMAALVAGRLIDLPGANQLQGFAVMILLYIPLGLLAGWLGSELIRGVASRWRRAGVALAVVGAVLLVALTIGNQLRVIQPAYILVTRPDVRAMAWVRESTPADAVFLVEGFRIYEGTTAVGSDAGWWLPLLAGRANTMPPQYALLNEVPSEPGYSQRVIGLVAALETHSPASDAGLAELCRARVTHIYIGQTQGATGAGARPLISVEDLLADARFTLLYHQDRVYVFALSPDVC
jgi:hypothetical protein